MRKQLFVAIGMMAAVVTLLVLWLHLAGLHLPLPEGDDPGSRLAFAARWLLLPALALFAGIVVVANQRFFVADAIDGARTSQSRLIEITLRYNQNTLEQTVLAAIAWAGLALALPHERLSLIPAMAIVFIVGRALFWIGYLIAPAARALGLGLSAYPTFAALIWLAGRMFLPK
ncbi:MAG TPA: MAPEG family protein [Steroidobacteraceae bacterium]